MDLRSLLAKIDQLSEADAAAPAAPAATVAPAWTPTPEQAKWLGGANQQDPYILSRMPGDKPPVSWFKDPADQKIAQSMGFPAQASAPSAPAAPVASTPVAKPEPTAQAAGAARTNDAVRTQSITKLKALLQQLKTTNPTLKEGFNLNVDGTATLVRNDGSMVTFNPVNLKILSKHGISMSSQLLESFGYDEFVSETDLEYYDWSQFVAEDEPTMAQNAGAAALGYAAGRPVEKAVAKKAAANAAAKAGTAMSNLAPAAASGIKGMMGKAVAKALPGVNTALGVQDIYSHAKKGDWVGAGLGALSTGLSFIPGWGWIPATAINMISMYRDSTQPEATATVSGALQHPVPNGPIAQLQKVIGATPDGVFGPKSQATLKAWQAQNGLTADGLPGPKTFKAAGIKLAESTRTPADMIKESARKLEAINNPQPIIVILDEGTYAIMPNNEIHQLDELSIPGASTLGAAWQGAKNLGSKAVKFATDPGVGKEITTAAGDTYKWLGNQWGKLTKAGGFQTGGQSAKAIAAAKPELDAAARGIKNLPGNVARAAMKNPGKTGLAALGGAGAAAMALGGGQAAPGQKPTTIAGAKPTPAPAQRPQAGQAGADVSKTDTGNQALIAQIQAEMATLSDYANGGDQEALALVQQAQQALDTLKGNTAQAAADVANVQAQQEPAPVDNAGDSSTLTVYGKDAADTAAKTAAARQAAAAQGTTTPAAAPASGEEPKPTVYNTK